MFQKYMKDAPLYDYFDKNAISKYHCGFRKGFSIQHVFPVMIEKLKISSDSQKFCAAIFTSLSKAFDCICRDLLISKLNAFGMH